MTFAWSEFLHSGAEASIPTVGRIIIGYVVELYFLVFPMVLVIRFRKRFERRALLTALTACAAIISTIVLRLLEKKGILLDDSMFSLPLVIGPIKNAGAFIRFMQG